MTAQELQAYDEWLADHIEELVTQYPSKVVAIYEDRVIFIGESEVEVYGRVKKAGLSRMPLVFRVPRPEDVHAIL